MAFAAGAIVANLYYNQPLLREIGGSLGARDDSLGLIPTLPQVGYALGLLLLVPIGDSQERRRWIVGLTCCVSVTLVAVALAPNLPFYLVASLLMGAAAVVPQMLIPFVAHLAPPEQRGRLIGVVMSGLLIGILLSRTVAGFVGEALGWRSLYGASAAAMLLLALALRLELPKQRPAAPMPYPALLRSLVHLFREEPVVRRHALLGAISFAVFAGFWATLALHLQALPAAHGPRVAGLFGVVGVAGALAAPLVGRYADHNPGMGVHRIAISLLAVAYGLLWVFGGSLLGLAAGVILLDLGAQANHIANQTQVYAQRPEARNRLNSLYMVGCFIGSSGGAYLFSGAWVRWGWAGVCSLGVGIACLGLLLVGPAAVRLRLPSAHRPAR